MFVGFTIDKPMQNGFLFTSPYFFCAGVAAARHLLKY